MALTSNKAGTAANSGRVQQHVHDIQLIIRARGAGLLGANGSVHWRVCRDAATDTRIRCSLLRQSQWEHQGFLLDATTDSGDRAASQCQWERQGPCPDAITDTGYCRDPLRHVTVPLGRTPGACNGTYIKCHNCSTKDPIRSPWRRVMYATCTPSKETCPQRSSCTLPGGILKQLWRALVPNWTH
jgi:hypothetical protein